MKDIVGKYSIDRSLSDKITVKTENDDIDINVPENMNIIECCVTRIEKDTIVAENDKYSVENGDLVKYIQLSDINGVSSQVVMNDGDIDEQNPIRTGELELDTDYLFIKYANENDEIVPIYIKLKDIIQNV